MRCLSCNKRLSNKESTRKYSSNGDFVDLCDHCYSFISNDISAVEGDEYVEDFESEEQSEQSFDGGEGLFKFEDESYDDGR